MGRIPTSTVAKARITAPDWRLSASKSIRPTRGLARGRPERTEPGACASGSRTRSPSSRPGAERGIVVEGAEIVECVGRGAAPATRLRRDLRRFAPCRAAGARQRPSSFLPDADPRPSRSAKARSSIPWLVAMERVWDRMTPEALRLAVRMALVELLLSGCTTAADHHNLFPPGLENAIDIEVEEARALGIRMTVTRGSMGISEKDGGLQPDSIVQDSDTILEDSERVLRLFHDPRARRDDPRRARALLAARGAAARDERLGRARRALRLPSALPPLPVARGGRLRDAGVRQALGRPSGGGRAGSRRAPGSRTASISTPDEIARLGAPASRSAIAPPPTWPSASAPARPGTRGGGRRRSASASTARPPTIPPT